MTSRALAAFGRPNWLVRLPRGAPGGVFRRFWSPKRDFDEVFATFFWLARARFVPRVARRALRGPPCNTTQNTERNACRRCRAASRERAKFVATALRTARGDRNAPGKRKMARLVRSWTLLGRSGASGEGARGGPGASQVRPGCPWQPPGASLEPPTSDPGTPHLAQGPSQGARKRFWSDF